MPLWLSDLRAPAAALGIPLHVSGSTCMHAGPSQSSTVMAMGRTETLSHCGKAPSSLLACVWSAPARCRVCHAILVCEDPGLVMTVGAGRCGVALGALEARAPLHHRSASGVARPPRPRPPTSPTSSACRSLELSAQSSQNADTSDRPARKRRCPSSRRPHCRSLFASGCQAAKL